MRIIAGSLRGRTLKSTQTSMLRPTTDRVRESIFNILTARIEFQDITVLDLFAGTGALGIEALSRGASFCTFVENDRRAATVIAGNLKMLDLTGCSRLVTRDAMKFLAETDARFDLIFADPPYASPVFDRLVKDVFQHELMNEDGLLVVEHSSAMKSIGEGTGELVTQRIFGETGVSIFSRS